jgi:hypothetical protein
MRTEAKKTSKHGFLISEQELRRIFDVLTQHIKRVMEEGKEPVTLFEVKFKNGAIANPVSLDEILQLENVGSGLILRLKIKVQDKAVDPTYQISLEFINADVEREENYVSVRYSVIGDNRDWVFVTSSEIDERVNRVKRFCLNQLIPQSRELFFLSLFAIALVAMGVMQILISFENRERRENYYYEVETIEKNWQNNEITDPTEVVFALAKIGENESYFRVPSVPIIYFLGSLFLLMLLLLVLNYSFPPYNFYWNDYIEVLNKKQSLAVCRREAC